MLIALFSLLSVLIFGGGASPYFLPDAEKLVKKNIEDKDRKKEILAYMKDYKKEWKRLQKIEKKQAKSFSKLNSQRGADFKELEKAFESSKEQRGQLHQKLINARVAVQKLVTDQEWETIIRKALDVKLKTVKKIDKKESKALVKQSGKIQAIGDEIEAAFTNQENKEKATEYLLSFEEDLINQLIGLQEFTYKDQEVFRDHEATEKDLKMIFENLENYRTEVHSSYLELRSQLVEISTEENWPKLSKALKKVVK